MFRTTEQGNSTDTSLRNLQVYASLYILSPHYVLILGSFESHPCNALGISPGSAIRNQCRIWWCLGRQNGMPGIELKSSAYKENALPVLLYLSCLSFSYKQNYFPFSPPFTVLNAYHLPFLSSKHHYHQDFYKSQKSALTPSLAHYITPPICSVSFSFTQLHIHCIRLCE